MNFQLGATDAELLAAPVLASNVAGSVGGLLFHLLAQPRNHHGWKSMSAI
jgi:hypothetical protein